LDEQPRRIAAGTALEPSVSSTSLHARFQPDDVLDFVMDQPVEVDQEVDGLALAAGNFVEKGAEARPERFEFEVGLELVGQDGVVGEGKFLGAPSTKKSKGLIVAMSAVSSTSTLNSSVFSGKTSRAWKLPCGSCCQLMKCSSGVIFSV
jgi:hypothetical protein